MSDISWRGKQVMMLTPEEIELMVNHMLKEIAKLREENKKLREHVDWISYLKEDFVP